MFIVNAVVLAIFGMLFMVMPEFVLTQFKSEVYVATIYVTRFFGAALLMSGLLFWLLLDVPAKKQKIIAFLMLAYSIGGFAMTLAGMTIVGVLRANGWVLLVLFGVFALIYAYMLFLQPKSTEAKPRAPRKPKPVPSAPTNGQLG
jgi:MFS family permease